MSHKMRKKSRSGGSETWRVVLRIIRSAKPIRWWLALACLLAVVVILCALAGPTLLGDLIQGPLRLLGGGLRVPGGLAASLVPGILALLGIYAVQSLFTYLKMLLMNNVVSRPLHL